MKKLFSALVGLYLCAFNMIGWADEVVERPRESAFNMQTIIMILIALVFFYFILWRPEQKRRKKAEQQRNALKKGDKVTAMGIVGTVSSIKETTIILKMYDGSKIEILKGAISDVQAGSEEDTRKAEKEDKSASEDSSNS